MDTDIYRAADGDDEYIGSHSDGSCDNVAFLSKSKSGSADWHIEGKALQLSDMEVDQSFSGGCISNSNSSHSRGANLSNSLQSQFSSEDLSSSNGKRVHNETNQDKLSKGIPRFKLFPNNGPSANSSRSVPNGLPLSSSSSTSFNASSYAARSNAARFPMNSIAALAADVPTSDDKMKSFFSMITLTPDVVQPIIGAMTKSKGTDNKEKQKRLESAVEKLHKLLLNLVGEVMQVRTQCILHEHNQNQKIRNQWRELTEYNRKHVTLAESDTKFKIEIQKLKQDGEAMKARVIEYSNEKSKLHNLIASFEHRKQEVIERQKREETLKQETHIKITRMERDLLDAKMEASHATNQAKELAEQRFEASRNSVIEEINELRQEINRRHMEAERFLEERSSLDHKVSHLRQEIVRFESSLREAEHTSAHYDREIQRLEVDLKMSKELILQQDKDINATLMDSSDVERQFNDERSNLKAEIDDLKSKLISFEDERDRLTEELESEESSLSTCKDDLAKMGEYSQALIECIEENSPNLGQIEGLKAQLKHELEAKEKLEWAENEARKEKSVFCDNTLAVRNDTENKLRDTEGRLSRDLYDVRQQVVSSIAQNSELQMEIERQSTDLATLSAQCVRLNQNIDMDKTKNRESIQKTSDAKKELLLLKKRIRDVQDQEIEEASVVKTKVADLEEQIQRGETKRRKLHNEIQELRGNIRVFARVRPFLQSDLVSSAGSNPSESTITTRLDGSSLTIARRISSDEMGEDYEFNYDRVFSQNTAQETIFSEVSEFVQSALDGYNVCLFSYGQTGSGKTHTMQGVGNGDERGIVPRAMEQVGRYKTELERQGWIYTMEVSFVEIYNETIKDLLRNSHKDDVKHEIRHDRNNKPYVTDIQMIAVDPNNMDQIRRITDLAARHRSVGQTAMNDRSSRSHSVFTLHLTAMNEHQGVNLKGTLSLVDLAGSERIDKSGVTGDRLRETQNINSSLSALSDVFVSLGNKSKHVPYRNSKLTHILQPALSGDGKTLMFVNLSPTNDSYSESISSLKFAKLVNRCELGKALKQMEVITPSVASSTSSSVSMSMSTSNIPSASISSSMSSNNSSIAKENKENASVSSSMSMALGGTPSKKTIQAPEKSSLTNSRGAIGSSGNSGSRSNINSSSGSSDNKLQQSSNTRVLAAKQPVVLPGRKLK